MKIPLKEVWAEQHAKQRCQPGHSDTCSSGFSGTSESRTGRMTSGQEREESQSPRIMQARTRNEA